VHTVPGTNSVLTTHLRTRVQLSLDRDSMNASTQDLPEHAQSG